MIELENRESDESDSDIMSSDSEASHDDFNISLHSRSIDAKKKKIQRVESEDWLEDPLVKPFKILEESNTFYHTDPAESRRNQSFKLENTIQNV